MKMQTTRVGIGNAGMACGLVGFLVSVCLSAISLPASAGPAYASWERGIRAECQAAGRSGGDRSGCFALMMERAVAEGHLTQGQVDGCRAQEQMRQRGRQVELAAWTRCGLRNAVQASVERPRQQAQARNSGSPSVARNETEVAAAPAAPPSGEATARARFRPAGHHRMQRPPGPDNAVAAHPQALHHRVPCIFAAGDGQLHARFGGLHLPHCMGVYFAPGEELSGVHPVHALGG